jgi:hypothetical protein
MNQQEMQLELDNARKENAMLKSKLTHKKVGGSLSFRIAPKGGVSLYGLGKWPVTLYKSQWNRILEKTDELRAYLETVPDKEVTESVQAI